VVDVGVRWNNIRLDPHMDGEEAGRLLVPLPVILWFAWEGGVTGSTTAAGALQAVHRQGVAW
jgi:hypothetical protein